MSIPGSVNPLFLGAAGQATGEGGYLIERSLRFNSPDSAYLSRTPASAGNRRTWTFSAWVKRSKLGVFQSVIACINASGSHYGQIIFNTDDTLIVYDTSATSQTAVATSQVFRDTSAWFHLLLHYNTTQSTAASKVKLYINGTEVTQFAVDNRSSITTDSSINRAEQHSIGSRLPFAGNYLDAYLADIHFIDGQALDPTSFGEFDATTGVWMPIEYTGTYGTNGFHLPFDDNSTAAALGTDSSGNGNNWTPNNLSVTAGAGNDSLVDVPTNGAETDSGVGGEVRGNYCTFNPLDNGGTLANGNLDFSQASAAFRSVRSTFAFSSGKWYWEGTLSAIGGAAYIGIGKSTASLTVNIGSTDTFGYVNNGNKQSGNTAEVAYGASYTTGDVIGVALDADTGTLTFYKNGTIQGQAYSGLTSGPYFMMVTGYNGTTWATNFGQRAFAYTAPSGFKALNTANLPAPVVTKPSTVFDTKLYTGNGSTNTITGLGFNPDFVWLKSRSSGSYSHNLYDAVRGATKILYSDSTSSENTDANGLTAFNSDGFSLGSTAATNASSTTYVAWAWDAGTSTVTNTAGSISSQVRANASAGFSVVTYTGTGSNATVGHGLGVAPGFIILKDRTSSAYNWQVYHSTFAGTSNSIVLNSTAAVDAGSGGVWNSTAPTSTVFSIGTAVGANTNGNNYVAYAFSPVSGYSSFGRYTGNGSADGSFTYLGFLPKLILIKRTDTTSNWTMLDTLREGYNVDNDPLYPNLSDAEGTTDLLDITSNGFKLRSTDASVNASGGTYIFAAWASNPFQYSRAR